MKHYPPGETRNLGAHAYRADIDGLRAVSVLAVIIFHAFPGVVTGGFIGVDVFFVISGFLITGIICEDIAAGSFTILGFYKRRVLRIFPALIAVLGASYALGWSILNPDEFKRLALHMIGGATFTSNIVLWTEAGYFDVASATKPLLHLWSLGVEEQFYILWPLLLVAARRLNIPALGVIVAVLVASFAIQLATIGAYPTAAFYLPFGRLWELAAGGLLAVAARTGRPIIPARAADILSISGLAAIVGAATLLSESHGFPGWRAAIPVMGAMALIAAGPQGLANRWILRPAPMVWVGRISYPLYLWHWVLLSFSAVLVGGPPPWQSRVALLVLAVIASWATYRFLERWIRNGERSVLKAIVLCVLMLAVTIAAFITWKRDGLYFRRGSALHADVSTAAIGAGKGLTLDECVVPKADFTHSFLCRRDKRGPSNVLLWGDSKSEALYWGLVSASAPDQRLSLVGRWACPPLPSVVSDNANGQVDPLCTDLVNRVDRALADNKAIESVVLVFSPNYVPIDPFPAPGQTRNAERAENGLDDAVGRLIGLGKQVVVVIDNPDLGRDPRTCMDRAARGWAPVRLLLGIEPDDSMVTRCQRPLADHLAETRAYRDIVARVAARHPQLVVYDPTHILCDVERGVCPMVRDRSYLYSYGNHISDTASARIAKELLPLIRARKQENP